MSRRRCLQAAAAGAALALAPRAAIAQPRWRVVVFLPARRVEVQPTVNLETVRATQVIG